MSDSVHIISPVEVLRPKGSHRIEAFSPKLARRVSLYNRAEFALWLMVETDPLVRTFCERPGYVQREGRKQLATFWIQYAAHEELLLLASTDDGDIVQSTSESHDANRTAAIRVVDFAELDAAGMWRTNWERMLPLVVANRRFISGALRETIIRFVTGPTQLSTIEREYSIGDPILVRATVFTLLHAGLLRAPILRTEALSPMTVFLTSPGSD